MPGLLRNLLGGDKPVKACWSTIANPQLVGYLARAEFDSVVLDMQHGFHDEVSVLAGIETVIAAGKAPIVRVPVEAWSLVERVLDFGALGVIAPMINTVADAERFARAMHYPPNGSRSYSPRHAASLHGQPVEQYLQKSNDELFGFAMVETREAFENLDAILAVPGIGGILLGPADFSISIRQNPVPDPYGPDTEGMIAEVASKVNAAGKVAAAFTDRAEHTRMVSNMGFQLISVAIDTGIVGAGIDRTFEAL